MTHSISPKAAVGKRLQTLLLTTTALAGVSGTALAQEVTTAEDVIVVTGTNIRGARVNEALPVTVVGADDIAAIGSVDAEDLIRNLPAQGATEFREDNNGTVNNARGDVASVNLRSIGSSGTLVLLNGRRVVNHPGTQAELSTPVTTTNVNALPVANIRRLEVLNDGASAIYGTDAVAGVVNTILKDDFTGLAASVRYGASEGTELDEHRFRVQAGKDFNKGKTNVNVSAEFSIRNGLMASEREYSATEDRRFLAEGTSFEGDVSLDNRSTSSPWGQFTLNTTSGTRVRQNGEILTTSAGRFHIQPTSFSGCRGDTADALAVPGLCIDDSSLNRELRHDGAIGRSIISDRDRLNLFGFLNHDFDNGLRFYSELGYYRAETDATNEPSTPISSGNIVIPANYYYNPFGPVTFSNGQANPNRLPGLSNVPAEGLPVFVDGGRYRFQDVGNRKINVVNDSWRAVTGLRGQFLDTGWDFDSGLVYSMASTEDTTTGRISSTLFQQALFNETPGVYNIFSGGDPDNPSLDSTPATAAQVAPFLIDVSRKSETELALADFKLTNGDVFDIPGGSIGIALGLEARYEAYEEDRDPRLDGTITFTDAVTGATSDSDVMGSSSTPDSEGDRTVLAAFAEASVPLVSPDMEIPFVNTFDLQLAARIEDYSDFGSSGVKPRVAAAWKPFDFIKFRGAWSEGFRAPNLLVVNERVQRLNTREDSYFCEAGVRNGTFTDFSDCDGFSEGRQERRVVADGIGPEEDTNTTYGFVFEPRGFDGFLSFLDGLTITYDEWEIERENVVGVFGGENHISLDYLLRLQGSSNPNVVRADPNVDQIDFFNDAGLTPVGDILFIQDTYDNNEDITVSGRDIAVYYDLDGTRFGDFGFKFNASQLEEYFVELSPGALLIAQAVEDGVISDEIDVAQEGDIVKQDGQPEWQSSGSATWRHDSGWGAGLNVRYFSSFVDTGVGLDPNGESFKVDAWSTANLYVQYEFDGDEGLGGTRIRLGANNIEGKEPPLADETNGYDAAYHSARGRYFYFDIRKEF